MDKQSSLIYPFLVISFKTKDKLEKTKTTSVFKHDTIKRKDKQHWPLSPSEWQFVFGNKDPKIIKIIMVAETDRGKARKPTTYMVLGFLVNIITDNYTKRRILTASGTADQSAYCYTPRMFETLLVRPATSKEGKKSKKRQYW